MSRSRKRTPICGHGRTSPGTTKQDQRIAWKKHRAAERNAILTTIRQDLAGGGETGGISGSRSRDAEPPPPKKLWGEWNFTRDGKTWFGKPYDGMDMRLLTGDPMYYKKLMRK